MTQPPALATATDPIHCAEDLRLRWRALMGPLGFAERLLWLGFVGADRRLHTSLTQIPVGRSPHRSMVENLMIGLSVLLDDLDAGTSVAVLLTRPGSGPVSVEDRRWAEVLTAAAERVGVSLEPIFRADDAGIVTL